MLNLNVANFSGYDYDDTDAESERVYITVKEVAGEPGNFRITAEGYYCVSGAYAHTYYDDFVDTDEYPNVYSFICDLFEHVDAAMCESSKYFDVVCNLYDAEGTCWQPLDGIVRNILADALIREGVDCYPLTSEDLCNIATMR